MKCYCRCCCCEQKEVPKLTLKKDTLHKLRTIFCHSEEEMFIAISDATIILGELKRRGIIDELR